MYGPTLSISKELHATKYRLPNETFEEACLRIASTLSDSSDHRHNLLDCILNMRYMFAGRIQAAVGSPRKLTPYNCFVSGEIEDSFNSIMEKATEAGKTMRLGGGIGYDFSTLRPRGGLIASLGSQSSGPVSFMEIYDAICGTISSAGHRRGAQMSVLRIDHPDIEEFILAKNNNNHLTRFNISVGITDKFMQCVKEGSSFDLKFKDTVYKTVDARSLWDMIMRATYDWAEPGVLFLDRINEMNNLYYCEDIATVNPCAEQPLPPYGACLLGSFNLIKYLILSPEQRMPPYFDYALFRKDINTVVRAMDNVIDSALYPLEQQRKEALDKRRMGIGVTGLANCLEALGAPYGTTKFNKYMSDILIILRDECYEASIDLAVDKGAFPLFDRDKYLAGNFIKSLPEKIRNSIHKYGIRNSHLLSIAPTGTISLTADNISSGIEPVYSYSYDRVIQTFSGPIKEAVFDYGWYVLAVKGRLTDNISAQEHVSVLINAQKYIDSAVSKTCNIGDDVSFDEFKDIYMTAYNGGAKGCTTFRKAGKRFGIFSSAEGTTEYINDEDEVCSIDETTGQKTCG